MTDLQKKKAAFDAWQSGKCSDEELALCIKSLDDSIETLQALRVGGIILSGLYMTLNSMSSAMDSRKRDRKAQG
jgi:hypothetical protein